MQGMGGHAEVIELNPTVEMTVTQTTKMWIEELYKAGAVTFAPDGTATLDGKVREMIRVLHAVLAGGEVNVEIVDKGGELGAKLEMIFDMAWIETNQVRKTRGHQGDSEQFDPVGP